MQDDGPATKPTSRSARLSARQHAVRHQPPRRQRGIPLQRGQDLLLLYRMRTSEEVLFRDELDRLAALRGARVQ